MRRSCTIQLRKPLHALRYLLEVLTLKPDMRRSQIISTVARKSTRLAGTGGGELVAPNERCHRRYSHTQQLGDSLARVGQLTRINRWRGSVFAQVGQKMLDLGSADIGSHS